ncbi:hypothetical protein Lxx01690 [Leifsonia xyli subsp. xyli str. CTCB07]|uniref:Uncharacterized protein n=1 Tax=Leifsonia xyli subsp. xyli (strain CTCB07) TaxID=281090 RepID=Q6AHB1_LEIXX|nr:hypothetical protein [Leifsonia xyli]AAT88234.1 hypothetical protein Lxx01690 [Leifsonia xyli subsp. xyli str. CTCB07]
MTVEAPPPAIGRPLIWFGMRVLAFAMVYSAVLCAMAFIRKWRNGDPAMRR